MAKVVLITGCSTGIGRDLAVQLTQAGYSVAATARRVETIADLPCAMKCSLDVTHPDSIQAAMGAVLDQFGRIDALVNNAGISTFGAAEEVSPEQLREIFDVNVFGLMSMVRAVLPTMRKQKSGRIVNISSLVGKLVAPANGPYAASKFAVEALSDALRLEVEPFGVRVILVEPGAIQSAFAASAAGRAAAIFANPTSPYQPLYRAYNRVGAQMRRGEATPEAVTRVIRRALEIRRPRARYTAGIPLSGRIVMALRDYLWDPVARQMYRLDGQG